MSKNVHPLHKEIADKLEPLCPPHSVIKDKVYGGNQHIPLFQNRQKSRATEYCNVDMLILDKNKIKVLIEIEESNVKPTQICGKFLTSALSNYYIHKNKKKLPIAMADSVIFIQIVESSKLKENSSKFRQWKKMESSIQSLLPLKNSKIKSYILVTSKELDRLTPILKGVL